MCETPSLMFLMILMFYPMFTGNLKALLPVLRIYPPRFAMRMASLHGRFCVKRSLDFGTMIEENNFNLGISLFDSMSWDSSDWWDDAHMKSVFMYLRGAHDLVLGSMRRLFPAEI